MTDKKQKQPIKQWWCEKCQCKLYPEEVTYWECHDERIGGCGGNVYPIGEDVECQSKKLNQWPHE